MQLVVFMDVTLIHIHGPACWVILKGSHVLYVAVPLLYVLGAQAVVLDALFLPCLYPSRRRKRWADRNTYLSSRGQSQSTVVYPLPSRGSIISFAAVIWRIRRLSRTNFWIITETARALGTCVILIL